MSNAETLVVNPAVDRTAIRPLDSTAVLTFHRSLPGYAVTPLVEIPEAATRLGVAQMWVKDESTRLGLPAFKILGASWAVVRELSHRLDLRGVTDLATLRDHLCQSDTLIPTREGEVPTTLVAATDGNHGRAVAYMARLLGLSATILVPHGTAAARIDAIAGEGAEVIVHPGDYDDAVRAAASMASARHVVIADTAWPGYEDVPSWVIEGYTTIITEVLDQLVGRGEATPTVVVVQVGVGAFAAGIVRSLAGHGTRVIAVEPETAACLAPSLAVGTPTSATGTLDSIMAGLNCGEVSPAAWLDLRAGVDVAVTVTDEDAREAMRLLARAGIESGESGAAGLAGLLRHPELLSRDDHVLAISTEGVTDPAAYPEILAGLEVSV